MVGNPETSVSVGDLKFDFRVMKGLRNDFQIGLSEICCILAIADAGLIFSAASPAKTNDYTAS